MNIGILKKYCPVCGEKELTSSIVTSNRKKDIEPVSKVYADDYCNECSTLVKDSFALIGFIGSKTKDPENPYRSGHIWLVDYNSLYKILGDVPQNKHEFIEINDAKNIGLPIT